MAVNNVTIACCCKPIDNKHQRVACREPKRTCADVNISFVSVHGGGEWLQRAGPNKGEGQWENSEQHVFTCRVTSLQLNTLLGIQYEL